MFVCPKCKEKITLPQCCCGYSVKKINNIWQLTDMPDMVTSGDGDKYIGYEHIGGAYSGNSKYVVEESDALFAKEISKITGGGVFLDLACGDGCFTVPCAENGTKIIAGDISNNMLSILQDKAKYNNVSLDNVTLCRMNALEIPLEDESVDTVVANSVLHLISNPEKVLREIYRVLKKGGVFICKDDSPGKTPEEPFDNSMYLEIVNSMYREYWCELNSLGIYAKKYSWKFERNSFCEKLFESKNVYTIEHSKVYGIPLRSGFFARFESRGFSDQAEVPKETHTSVISDVVNKMSALYGENFLDISCKAFEGDIIITTYKK